MGPFAVILQQPRDQLSVKGRWLHEQVLVIIEELFAKATVKPLHMKLESGLPSCYLGFLPFRIPACIIPILSWNVLSVWTRCSKAWMRFFLVNGIYRGASPMIKCSSAWAFCFA